MDLPAAVATMLYAVMKMEGCFNKRNVAKLDVDTFSWDEGKSGKIKKVANALSNSKAPIVEKGRL